MPPTCVSCLISLVIQMVTVSDCLFLELFQFSAKWYDLALISFEFAMSPPPGMHGKGFSFHEPRVQRVNITSLVLCFPLRLRPK